MASITYGFFVFALLHLFQNATGSSMWNVYCTQYTNVYINLTKVGTSRIATRTMEDGENKYSDKLFCSWTIYAGIGKRVVANVKKVDIGTLSEGADCYDHTFAAIKQYEVMDSFDWLNADPGVYYRMCGTENPQQITSKDDELTIEFTSGENTDNFKGIEFVVAPFDEGTCFSGQDHGERNGYCYQMFDNNVPWVDAQEICTLQQGNLVSFIDDAESEFVKSLIMNFTKNVNPSSFNSWSIGLHNMDQQATYTWIDKIEGSFTLPSQLHSDVKSGSSNDKQCIAMTTDGTFESITCSTSSYPFICKSQKDGNSKLFKAPVDNVQPTSDGNSKLFKAPVDNVQPKSGSIALVMSTTALLTLISAIILI